jgi:hypothetical protein
MARPLDFRGRTVLVTGASSGLGKDMARILARDHGANLLLVARRRDALAALCSELSAQHKIKADFLVADLVNPVDVERIFDEATAQHSIYAVILNAGVTYFGQALEQPQASVEALLATNVSSTVRLTSRFVPYLIARQEQGGVLLVSSMAGFTPMPFQAVYGASKAFVTSYGQSLAEEVKATGVTVAVFAPGGIATEMLESSGISRKFKAGDVGIMASDACAREGLEAFRRRRGLHVPGGLNQLTSFVTRLAPRSFVAARVADIYRGALPKP